jgi:hypothetical protein
MGKFEVDEFLVGPKYPHSSEIMGPPFAKDLRTKE